MHNANVKIGMRVKTAEKFELTNSLSILLQEEYMTNRKVGATGRVKELATGHQGLIWWVIHRGGVWAPYFASEFELVV